RDELPRAQPGLKDRLSRLRRDLGAVDLELDLRGRTRRRAACRRRGRRRGLGRLGGLGRFRLLLFGLLLFGHALLLIQLSAVGAAVLLDVRLELVLELREVALGRPRERLGEDADRLPRRLLRDRLDRLEVFDPTLALLDPLEDLLHPARA